MRKHILSKFAEKKVVNGLNASLMGTTKCTDSLESTDADCFNQNCDQHLGTQLTEKIEPSDVEIFNIENGWTQATYSVEPSDVDMLNAGVGWTKATETIESSDVDYFERNIGGDSTKLSAYLEPADMDVFC